MLIKVKDLTHLPSVQLHGNDPVEVEFALNKKPMCTFEKGPPKS